MRRYDDPGAAPEHAQEGAQEGAAGRPAGPAPLRFGIMGAARIAPNALIKPARAMVGVEVRAVAARSLARAEAFARTHQVDRAYGDYDALLRDESVDAVYIALPNALHAEWAIRALQAGKHVLCEKPLAANAAQAQSLADAAAASNRLFVEAFHNLYHPLLLRMRALVTHGALGRVQSVRGVFNTTMRRKEDIRFEYALGGGAMMDLGCYLVSMTRFVLGCGEGRVAEPTVLSAEAHLMKPDVDARMHAQLRSEQGEGEDGEIAIALECAMQRWRLPSVYFEVQGETGRMVAVNPILPQIWHRLTFDRGGERAVESLGMRSTYLYQLEAFVEGVYTRKPLPTSAREGVRNMAVIDAVYRAAGMQVR